MRVTRVTTGGDLYIITLRGRTQDRTRVLKANLTDTGAAAIRSAIEVGIDGGWLDPDSGVQCVMLMKQWRSSVVLGIIDSLCTPDRLNNAELKRLDSIMSEPA